MPPNDSQLRQLNATVMSGQARGRSPIQRVMTDREVGFVGQLDPQTGRQLRQPLNSTMGWCSLNFEDADDQEAQRTEEAQSRRNDQEAQRAEEAWARRDEENYLWCYAFNWRNPGAGLKQSRRNPSAKPRQPPRDHSAALIRSGAAFSAIGAANASGQDIIPFLNDLTKALRSVQSSPERGVEAVTPVLQNLTTLTEMLYGRVRVLQGGNMKNGGWTKFNGTFKNYPSFKRKWALY